MLEATRRASLAEIKRGLELSLGPGAVELVGDGETGVLGVTEDSRRAAPGCLFVARPGSKGSGRDFVEAAVAGGAVAVLAPRGMPVDFVPRLLVADVESALGRVAELLSGFPSRHLRVIGITGTNGKTTTAALVAQALAAAGRTVARLGTLGLFLGDEHVKDTLTTPSAEDLSACMRLAVQRGIQDFVMEVSSHALAQGRVAGIEFSVAAFTNLSQDHLDYHGSMEEYGAAKARLFALGPKGSVINVNDSFGRALAASTTGALTVSIDPKQAADLVAGSVRLSKRGISLELSARGRPVALESALLGEFNAENLLLALGILTELGYQPEDAARHLGAATAVPGRLERVDQSADDVVALVDYAHTPDAVARALDVARGLGPSRIVCVLGCGGDRDKQKRPLMGRAAAERADDVWVTTDNPRSEDPAEIAREVLRGTEGKRASVRLELDRREAIRKAVLSAPPEAMILVLGKGHETYQLVGSKVLDFDDRVEVKSALEERRGGHP